MKWLGLCFRNRVKRERERNRKRLGRGKRNEGRGGARSFARVTFQRTLLVAMNGRERNEGESSFSILSGLGQCGQVIDLKFNFFFLFRWA